MLGVHPLCKELRRKQPKTETPGLKARACALSVKKNGRNSTTAINIPKNFESMNCNVPR
jgi:hypothetical protein